MCKSGEADLSEGAAVGQVLAVALVVGVGGVPATAVHGRLLRQLLLPVLLLLRLVGLLLVLLPDGRQGGAALHASVWLLCEGGALVATLVGLLGLHHMESLTSRNKERGINLSGVEM